MPLKGETLKKSLETIGQRIWNPYCISILVAFVIVGGALGQSCYRVPDNLMNICWITACFLAGYCVVRPFSTLPFWKYLVYLVATLVFQGWITSLAASMIHRWLGGGQMFYGLYLFFPFAVGILWTVGFLKFLFKFDTKTAILLGILIGIACFTGIARYR